MMNIRDNGCYCFTLETIDTVDIFTRPMYKQIIVHSLNHFIDSKGLIVYGWSLMSNKLYLICQSLENVSLSELGKSFLKFTCCKIVEVVGGGHSERDEWLLKHFKHSSFFDEGVKHSCWGHVDATSEINMKHPQEMAEQLEFIHSIPVKDRVVQYPSDYIYSSARDYEGMSGLVKVTRSTKVERELFEIESRKNGFRKSYYPQLQQ